MPDLIETSTRASSASSIAEAKVLTLESCTLSQDAAWGSPTVRFLIYGIFNYMAGRANHVFKTGV